MKNMNYKTFIPALVGFAVLTYQSVTGHMVDAHLQNTISNDSLDVIGVGLTLWGIYKNHKKTSQDTTQAK